MSNKSIWDNSTRAPLPMMKWTDKEICQFYDQNPNLLLEKFAPLVGRSLKEVKTILMSEKKHV